MLSFLKENVPRPIKQKIKYAYYCILDFIDFICLRKRSKYIPPRRKIYIGESNFKIYQSHMDEFFKYFKELCHLKPHETVLDVGCGTGRMAVNLINYIGADGIYEGFDIVKDGIDWCNKTISSENRNFHFQLADIYNKEYNPRGVLKPEEYIFPYGDSHFDFVFLTSIFTHMLPAGMEHYFSEISRVLKKNGRCLITFFLLNDESSHLMNEGKNIFQFKYDNGLYRLNDKNVPEAAIAYKEDYILGLFDKNSLIIKKPIYYGYWAGREEYLYYQDMIIAYKNA